MAGAGAHVERDDRAGAASPAAAAAAGLRSGGGGGCSACRAARRAAGELLGAAGQRQTGWPPPRRAGRASAAHPRRRTRASQRPPSRRRPHHRGDPHGLRSRAEGRGVVSGGGGDLCPAPLVGVPRPYGRASAGRPRSWSTIRLVRRRLRRSSRCFFTCRLMSSASSWIEWVIVGEHSRACSVTPFK